MVSSEHLSTEATPFDPFADAPSDEVRRELFRVRAAGCPFTPVGPGIAFVAHHDVARQALLSHEALSNTGNFVLDAGDGPAPPSLITQSDPPAHTALRALLRPGFTRATIVQAAPWIREHVEALIDALPPGGPADLVGQVALPLTASVIARLVGVPPEHAEALSRDSLAITAILPAPFTGTDAWQRLERYFTEAARQRRTALDPPDDLLTTLALGEVDGHRLTEQEVAFHAWQLFVAGLESTAYTIGSTVHQLLVDRRRWEALLADRSLLDNAREEGLRHGSAIRWVLRTVTSPVDIGGEPPAVGGRVVVGLESANFDESVFGPTAAAFDLRRPTARRHLSFGHGIHLCPGAELSRTEITVALQTLMDRLPALRLAPGTAYEKVESPMICGPKRLDVVW
ncbi:cytochrome P450, family 142, subfamily A, polypeptide 1 [Pseudonocardia thermophila]|uniref:Cytochrome P450, family 142, subfamily A, polypeptide 1 n=1 Tax=Pseudonocardia thermophila TaxID=1848 RepID=A0A1M6RXT8_PSETH|nr:cytochrome P450 [Pseudonocardia thermophila]SHK37283.1 cytochrome P450, family 142, subfamily A, polypeptide 1 [Pseudonocardia thermophila]